MADLTNVLINRQARKYEGDGNQRHTANTYIGGVNQAIGNLKKGMYAPERRANQAREDAMVQEQLDYNRSRQNTADKRVNLLNQRQDAEYALGQENLAIAEQVRKNTAGQNLLNFDTAAEHTTANKAFNKFKYKGIGDGMLEPSEDGGAAVLSAKGKESPEYVKKFEEQQTAATTRENFLRNQDRNRLVLASDVDKYNDLGQTVSTNNLIQERMQPTTQQTQVGNERVAKVKETFNQKRKTNLGSMTSQAKAVGTDFDNMDGSFQNLPKDFVQQIASSPAFGEDIEGNVTEAKRLATQTRKDLGAEHPFNNLTAEQQEYIMGSVLRDNPAGDWTPLTRGKWNDADVLEAVKKKTEDVSVFLKQNEKQQALDSEEQAELNKLTLMNRLNNF